VVVDGKRCVRRQVQHPASADHVQLLVRMSGYELLVADESLIFCVFSLEAIAPETSRWSDAAPVQLSSSSSSSASQSKSGDAPPLGVVSVFRVSRHTFHAVVASAGAQHWHVTSADLDSSHSSVLQCLASLKMGRSRGCSALSCPPTLIIFFTTVFLRSMAQIVFDNEHSLMLSDPPVCVPGPLEQLLAVPPASRDTNSVKAIAIALSCLPFFQGFSPLGTSSFYCVKPLVTFDQPLQLLLLICAA
jgi:hypothetical protein